MKFAKVFSATLAIFLLYTTVTEGVSLARTATELRCQCIKTEKPEKPIKGMTGLELIFSGPHCKNIEVIITLESGSRICVDPTTPWIEKIINKQLKSKENDEAMV